MIPGTSVSGNSTKACGTGTKAGGTVEPIPNHDFVVHICKKFERLSGAEASQDFLKQVVANVGASEFSTVTSSTIPLNEINNCIT